jgi:HlyD family secretion protein
MKFQFSKTYFLWGILLILLFNYKLFYSPSTSTTTQAVTMSKIQVWDIQTSIEVVWEANLVDEQSIRFNKVGKITKVYFKEGVKVKKGDIIAELDNKDAESTIKEAQLNLENAQLSLKQLYDWVDQSQILQSKNTILSAENNLSISIKEFENLKKNNANSLLELQKNLDLSEKDIVLSSSSYETLQWEFETLKKEQLNSLNSSVANKWTTIIDIEDSFRSNIAQIWEIILEADYILGVSDVNKDKNDTFEMFLWAKDSWTKANAEISLGVTIDTYAKVQKDYKNYDNSWERQKLLSLLTEFLAVYNQLYNSVDTLYKTLESSIPSEWSLSQTDIDSKKSKMSSYRTTILSKISTLNKSINTLNTLTDIQLLSEGNNNTLKKKEEALKSAEVDIEKKKVNLESLKNDFLTTKTTYSIQEESKEKDIESKKNTLEIAKISSQELIEWPTSENVLKAQNTIRQAEIRLASSQESLSDYQLTAPFDGIIRKIDYKVWDNLTSDVEKYVYIENPNLLEINVMLDQIDITKVKLWQDAVTVFDAYPNQKVASKITVIDTTPVQTSWVVSYKVKLILDDPNFKNTVLSGMTANIQVITESRQKVLTVKSTALQEINGKKILLLQKNWQEQQVEVKTGLSSWWMTEIISWVNEWDTIIIKDFSVSTQTEGSKSLFSPPAGMRRSSNSSSSGWAGWPPF